MPAAPTVQPMAADSTGNTDLQFINRVRDGLNDYPNPLIETWTADGVNGTLGFGSVPLRVGFPPIFGALADSNQPIIRDTTTATNYTVIESGTPTATQILVNYDIGTLQFGAVPAANDVIAFGYQSVKWRDTTIVDALYDGLRAIFPAAGKTYVDLSINIAVNTWDYSLPAYFADPRSKIISVEIADPYIPTQPFKPAPGGVDRIGLQTLHLPWAQRFSPVARLRITGWGPYLRLGDLEPQLEQLPIWYALGVLLTKKEAKRIREDTLIPLVGIGGVQPGQHVQTGDYYQRRFEAALHALARLPGPTQRMRWGTTYQRNRY